MRLSIGENIKRLRRERDITQEQLAEIFNVSCQTISRWETDSSYPDIEMLPVIADFFNTTVDKLMGTDEMLVRNKVDKYLSDYKLAISHGDVYECIRIAREGVKEFPNNYELLNKLMDALFISGDSDGGISEWKENMQKCDAEITELGERIMKYCTDQDIRLEATIRLAFNHCEQGRKKEGRRIYEALPSWEHCREFNIYWALEDGEELEHARNQIIAGYEILSGGINKMTGVKGISDEELLKVYEKQTQLDNVMYDGAPPDDCYGNANDHCCVAEKYARLGNKEKAIEHLKIAVEHALLFDANDHGEYESLLLGKKSWTKSNYETNDPRPLRIRMRDKWLQEKDFSSIRETKEFKEIIESLS